MNLTSAEINPNADQLSHTINLGYIQREQSFLAAEIALQTGSARPLEWINAVGAVFVHTQPESPQAVNEATPSLLRLMCTAWESIPVDERRNSMGEAAIARQVMMNTLQRLGGSALEESQLTEITQTLSHHPDLLLLAKPVLHQGLFPKEGQQSRLSHDLNWLNLIVNLERNINHHQPSETIAIVDRLLTDWSDDFNKPENSKASSFANQLRNIFNPKPATDTTH